MNFFRFAKKPIIKYCNKINIKRNKSGLKIVLVVLLLVFLQLILSYLFHNYTDEKDGS